VEKKDIDIEEKFGERSTLAACGTLRSARKMAIMFSLFCRSNFQQLHPQEVFSLLSLNLDPHASTTLKFKILKFDPSTPPPKKIGLKC
jgi:hypothetical protein